jgi:serine/threonine protein kinase
MDKYQILHELGEGNFAKVYLAKNVQTQEEVSRAHLQYSRARS